MTTTQTAEPTKITNRADLVHAIDTATGGRLPLDALDALVNIGAALWDNGYHAGAMDEFKGRPEHTPNPATTEAPATITRTIVVPAPTDDDTETPLVLAARAKIFKNGKCLICGHYEGDHESFGDGKFTCDDDCDEDLNGYCHPGRL